MSFRVPVTPALLHWAMNKAGLDLEDLSGRFDDLSDWLAGKAFPTMKQLEDFACATEIPVGWFFWDDPPGYPTPKASPTKKALKRDVYRLVRECRSALDYGCYLEVRNLLDHLESTITKYMSFDKTGK